MGDSPVCEANEDISSRAGHVKSTPTRGVKQYLKPDAYKQSEGP